MTITKYEHACVVLEHGGQKLVIDPGEYSVSLPADLRDVAALVVTHQHPDHLDTQRIQQLKQANPSVKIFTPADTVASIDSAEAVGAGDSREVGPFELRFTGGDHAIIDKTVPAQNVGVIVNGTFYYPGDSFELPGQDIDCVAVPASGPWMKVGEAMDFIRTTKARQYIPTHDKHLSLDTAVPLHDRWLGIASEEVGARYVRIDIGGSMEIAA